MKRFIVALMIGLMGGLWQPAGAAPQPPEVRLWVARDAAPGPQVRLNLNTRNVRFVRLAVYRLEGIRWLLDRDENTPGSTRQRPRTSGAPVREWSVNTAAKGEKPNPLQIDFYRSRQVNLPVLAPGIYLIEDDAHAGAWAVVNVTNLAVVTKRSASHLLAWVCDFRSGKPVAGGGVTLYNPYGTSVATGQTRADGTVLLGTPPGQNQVLVAVRGRDLAGVRVGSADGDGRLVMHFQTDRPVYRPGQTVHFKAILRRTQGRGWAPLANAKCAVQVRDAKDFVLLEKPIGTNAIGTLADEVELPQEGSLGQYSVTIQAPGAEAQYGSFSVAEYRKPEFKVVVKPEKPRYLAGEKATFTVQTNYYFGAPLPHATVRYVIRRADLPFWGGADDVSYWYGGDGNLYDRDTYYRQPFVAEDTVETDDKGQAVIRFQTQAEALDSSYTMQVTAIDASRRQVEESASVPVYRAAIRLGLSSEYSFVPLGYVIPLTVKAADLDGKPVAAHVTLILKKPVWNAKEGRYRFEEITRTRVDVPATGQASAKLPGQTAGSVVIEARADDGTGRTAKATLGYWVAGPFTDLPRETHEPTLQLKLDRRSYAPGATAKVLITTNTPARPVLVVAEGRDIWDYAVLPAGSKSRLWDLKTTLAMSPNAYASAAQWAGGQLLGDNAVLPVPDPSRKLRVTIVPERAAYKPGEPARYVVKTVTPDGQPVAAEVAVAVVDEAIYAVRPDNTPDLYALFWALRQNFVQSASSAPEELSGGAYQRVNKMASVRERFLDTAYWSARVQTGPDGLAHLTVDLPGNLTTWRATARAITGGTQVGTGKASIQVSRPVMLRLATPRQMVHGDRLRLVGTVHNRTEQPHDFETTISAQGLKIEGPTTQTVMVPARSEKTVTWTIIADTLPADGQAVLQGRTLATDAPKDQGEEFSDVLRVPLRIVPEGILHRLVRGGALAKNVAATLNLPADRLEPASTVRLTLRNGLSDVLNATAREVMQDDRHNSPAAASRLLVAALAPDAVPANEARESLALLSRYQQGAGTWGWWEDDAPDAAVTAYVLSVLARARYAKIAVPDALLQRGVAGARQLYDEAGLGERRAILAAAITLADTSQGQPLLDEVARRHDKISPYARLALAEAWLKAGSRGEAGRLARAVLENVNEGPDTAWIPASWREGWTATPLETNAQALALLGQLEMDAGLQAKFAQWLGNPEDGGYHSQPESAAIVRALSKYARAHPAAKSLGDLTVTANGTRVDFKRTDYKQEIQIVLPSAALRDGDNKIELARSGDGEIFYQIEARIYRPAEHEWNGGIRVFRRYDVQTEANMWEELHRAVKPGEPVRCTVLVWPDDRSDGIRVTEPLPAGFEFVDSDTYGGHWEQEVRDGAVVHYLRGDGKPIYFRYYLRAESEGKLLAPPALAEVLRRPSVRGNSEAQTVEVEANHRDTEAQR